MCSKGKGTILFAASHCHGRGKEKKKTQRSDFSIYLFLFLKKKKKKKVFNIFFSSCSFLLSSFYNGCELNGRGGEDGEINTHCFHIRTRTYLRHDEMGMRDGIKKQIYTTWYLSIYFFAYLLIIPTYTCYLSCGIRELVIYLPTLPYLFVLILSSWV